MALNGRRILFAASCLACSAIFSSSGFCQSGIASVYSGERTANGEFAHAERMTAAELSELERALAALEQAITRQDLAAAKAAHDAFHGLLLASARNPLLVAMFNQAQVARLSNISPEHKSFYDPRHLAHHRALLRALRKRDARAASAVVRKHFQSLGLMLEFVTRTRRKPAARVLALAPQGQRRVP